MLARFEVMIYGIVVLLFCRNHINDSLFGCLLTVREINKTIWLEECKFILLSIYEEVNM
jgi:hypothetical protein